MAERVKIRKIKPLQYAAAALALPGIAVAVLSLVSIVDGFQKFGSEDTVQVSVNSFFFVFGLLHIGVSCFLWWPHGWATFYAKAIVILWLSVLGILLIAMIVGESWSAAAIIAILLCYKATTYVWIVKGTEKLEYELKAAEWDRVEPRGFTPIMKSDDSESGPSPSGRG